MTERPFHISPESWRRWLETRRLADAIHAGDWDALVGADSVLAHRAAIVVAAEGRK